MAQEKLVIAVVVGTVREGRASFNAAKYVADFGRTLSDVEIVFVDPRDFKLPPDGGPEDGRDAKWSDITARADAFFIVTPEYNHSFPGSLKRLLDSELGNYRHKAVAVAGASSGNWGGVRAVEALLGTLRHIGLSPVATELYFPYVQNMFDEDGQLKPEHTERYNTGVRKMYDELSWLAGALKWGREHLNA